MDALLSSPAPAPSPAPALAPALAPGPLSLYLYFVIDSSGSMLERTRQVETGYQEFLQHQKSIQTPEIPVLVSTLFFNHEITVVAENIPLHQATDLKPGQYLPHGCTALRDAMGETLTKIRASLLTATPASKKHIVIVLTDGLENSSRNISREDLARLIEETKDVVEIVYMGSNQDAILQGGNVGASPRTSLTYTDSNLLTAIRSTTNAVGRMRSGETSTIQYTTLERDSSMGVLFRRGGRLDVDDDGYDTDDTVVENY